MAKPFLMPGVYVQETPSGSRPITAVATSITAFVGSAADGPLNLPLKIESFAEFEMSFGGLAAGSPMTYAVRQFFENGGREAVVVRVASDCGKTTTPQDVLGDPAAGTGIYALDKADLFNLLCLPPLDRKRALLETEGGIELLEAAYKYCVHRRAMLIVDPGFAWQSSADVVRDLPQLAALRGNAALYFPLLRMLDPLQSNQVSEFAPCGAVAGVIARTDDQRGVWKAAAGSDAGLRGVTDLSVSLTQADIGVINVRGVNCLRNLAPLGNVIWGSRTLDGADQPASEWKYVPVRRLALWIEESLFRGTQWVVFEPNEEPLWAEVRRDVSDFMNDLFRAGAFVGTKPEEAFLIQVGRDTMTQDDIDAGRFHMFVGFAALRPAEFTIIRISQSLANA